MQFLTSFLVVLSCLHFAYGKFLTPLRSPKPAPLIHVRDDNPEAPVEPNPCGKIIDDVNNEYAYFYARDALACLTSVPFHAGVATRFINYINTTIQFQSTLAYLKSPPIGYQQPPVDILKGLELIQSNITAGYYTNQYNFEVDLQHLIYSAHDAHLTLTSGILASFSFLAPFEISSVSTDGKALPKVYITTQIKNQTLAGPPSAIKSINNETAIEFLTKLAALNAVGNVEDHTEWNQLFTTPTLDILGDSSLFYGALTFYPGDDLVIELEDGKRYNTSWLARFDEPYNTGPLTTGGDFYNYFVLNLPPASYNETETFNPAYRYTGVDEAQPTNATAGSWHDISSGAYPNPDIIQPGLAVVEDGILSGYILKDVDAAVLSIPSFDQVGPAVGNFGNTVDYFLHNATKAKVSRIVIDLQQNTGGTVELVFSTFRRFFPDAPVPFAASRRRSHYLGDILGESYSTRYDDITRRDLVDIETVANEWVITSRLNAATGKNFTSWAQYNRAVLDNGDTFSQTERYNLSSWVFDRAIFDTWMPWGYTERYPNATATPPDKLEYYPRRFEAENIVLLTDGVCSSACALLVEFFTQAGAKTIVVGGQPTAGPMQAVGGNRGAAAYSSDSLDDAINFIGQYNTTAKSLLPQLNPQNASDSGVYTTYFGVNLRDQIRPNDPIPLQFKYEPANCRIFYSLANVYNMSRLWRDVITASFDDNALCVEGSNHFKNVTVSPPAPRTLNISPEHHGGPDGHEYTFDTPGDGLQDFDEQPRSGVIKTCDDYNGCGPRSQCQTVTDLPCITSDTRDLTAKLCLWQITSASAQRCSSGTVFKRVTWLPAKQVFAVDDRDFAISGSYTGFCWPAQGSTAWGCPKQQKGLGL